MNRFPQSFEFLMPLGKCLTPALDGGDHLEVRTEGIVVIDIDS